MYAVGVFFERHGGTTSINEVLTQPQAELAFLNEEAMTDTQYKEFNALPFATWLTLGELRSKFNGNIQELIKQAATGEPIVVDGEETLFAIAGCRKAAKQAFAVAYAEEAVGRVLDEDEDD